MPIREIHKGNLFDSQCQTLVNAVNCVGGMGGGIALAFYNHMQHTPEYFQRYQRDCAARVLRPGVPMLWRPTPIVPPGDTTLADGVIPPGKWIINFPTKDDWRHPSLLQYISDGLAFLTKVTQKVNPIGGAPEGTSQSLLEHWGVTSIAVPALGCGLGGLEWDDVRPIMFEYLQPLPIEVEIYAPPHVAPWGR